MIQIEIKLNRKELKSSINDSVSISLNDELEPMILKSNNKKSKLMILKLKLLINDLILFY